MKQFTSTQRILVTVAVTVVALLFCLIKWWDYVVNPWTRNGQVHAQVIQVTPRVSGTIVDLPIVDNQFVKAGELLFQIDPRTFARKLDHERAELRRTRAKVDSYVKRVDAQSVNVSRAEAKIRFKEQQVEAVKARLEDFRAELRRYERLVEQRAASTERLEQAIADVAAAEARVIAAEQEVLDAVASKLEAEADLAEAVALRGRLGEANASITSQREAVRRAELDLEFTEVRALVDGYITNLNMRLGDHATENSAKLALVDINSFWVFGFFKESYIRRMQIGDQAVVTLMAYPDQPLTGYVESIGWGIHQDDGSTGEELLPKINETFEWIRLAQRIPVRIVLDPLPEGVELRVGTTASVMVRTGTKGEEQRKKPVASPELLQ